MVLSFAVLLFISGETIRFFLNCEFILAEHEVRNAFHTSGMKLAALFS